MAEENRNSQATWRQKLEGLHSLEENRLNKEQAWERLHQRLHGRKAGSRNTWYRVAAAVILLAISLVGLRLLSGKKTNNTSVTISKKPGILNSKQSKPVQQKTIPGNEFSSGVSKNLNKQYPSSKQKKYSTIIEPVSAKDPKTTAQQITGQSLTLQATKLDHFSVLASAPATNNKLKVVHINELGDPPPNTASMVRNKEPHSFQLTIGKEEIFLNPSALSGKPGIGLIKTKISAN